LISYKFVGVLKTMEINKIILLGYMGCGKSAVGSLLKERLGFSYWDLDHFIEEKSKISIPEIFKTKGEIHFRKMERDYLEKALLEDPLILSTGGGTPCYYDTMSYLNSLEGVKTIYLKTSVKELSRRLFEAQSNRPLLSHLKTIEAFQEFVGKHLFERSVFYNEAHLSIVTDNKSIVEVAIEIQKSLA